MLQTIVNAFKIKEVRRKILITIALLFVYRIGCWIPVPGIEGFNFENAEFMSIMDAINGGALTNATFFAMGIGPYINASIIIQLLTVGIPALERLSKQGEEGKRKINTYTRILTLFLAIAQAVGILLAFGGENISSITLFGFSGKFAKVMTYIFLVIIYTAGAALTMWIGERITDYGVSNGISLLIFAGILSTLGRAVLSMILALFGGNFLVNFWKLLGFVGAALIIFAAIVCVNSAERKIPVQYAKQVKGRKMYGGQSTHIPIKVNSSGVMPLIFAFAILSLPDLIMSLAGVKDGNWWQTNLGAGTVPYFIILCVLILFFSYFYNQIQFHPDDISKSIQSNGGFIPGTRPGKPTGDYLRRVANRITLFGAIYLAIIALIPSLIFSAIDQTLVTAFSATGLLIVVSVALEFDQALQSQIMMKNYKGFLK